MDRLKYGGRPAVGCGSPATRLASLWLGFRRKLLLREMNNFGEVLGWSAGLERIREEREEEMLYRGGKSVKTP